MEELYLRLWIDTEIYTVKYVCISTMGKGDAKIVGFENHRKFSKTGAYPTIRLKTYIIHRILFQIYE